jgi:sarcosine oxidase
VGAGVVGLAVTYELVRAGERVDCFEATAPMAVRSRGDTRIFRLAHDRAPLVDLALRARDGWRHWSSAAGAPLVDDRGTVISGDIAAIAAAMADADAPYEITDRVPALPAHSPVGPFLHDRGGGVIQASATGRFLVDAVGKAIVPVTITASRLWGDTAILSAADGWQGSYDSVVVAAGAGTSALVAPVGIRTPNMLEHHVRMDFPLRDATARPPCWIDRSEAWRLGFRSYGHSSAPGRWAVGGHWAEKDTSLELTPQEVTERTRQMLTPYVDEYVTGCEPEVIDSLYCAVTPGLGDGVSTARKGAILAVWGENLFKLAPVLGRTIARAARQRAEAELPVGVGCTE